ncbi:MAG: hypothetical protein ACREA2_17190, partial [Blastocatellia bacterium]
SAFVRSAYVGSASAGTWAFCPLYFQVVSSLWRRLEKNAPQSREGSYEDTKPTLWLRWCDERENLIATGAERAAREAERAAREAERAALLAEKLRELGVDPDSIMPGKQ